MFHKVLILVPHTDDGEFGCGGSIGKWIDEDRDVYYIAFSSAEKSVLKGRPKDILRKEIREAVKVLGMQKENLSLFLLSASSAMNGSSFSASTHF